MYVFIYVPVRVSVWPSACWSSSSCGSPLSLLTWVHVESSWLLSRFLLFWLPALASWPASFCPSAMFFWSNLNATQRRIWSPVPNHEMGPQLEPHSHLLQLLPRSLPPQLLMISGVTLRTTLSHKNKSISNIHEERKQLPQQSVKKTLLFEEIKCS